MSSNERKYLVKSVDMAAIKLKSQLDSQSLYEAVTLFSETPTTDSGVLSQAQSRSQTRSKRSKSTPKRSLSDTSPSARVADELSLPVLAFLRLWLSLSHPFHPASDLLQKADIKSGSVRDGLVKTLLRHKLIVIHEIQRSRARVQVWEPTDVAYQLMQIPKPQFPSKGGFLHQFIAHCVVKVARQLGYVAKLEFFLSSGKAVDVALFKGGVMTAIEIAVAPPPTKELENIIADFTSDPGLTKLILVATDSKARNQLQALINADARTHVFSDRIQLTLAGCFLNVNPELSHEPF